MFNKFKIILIMTFLVIVSLSLRASIEEIKLKVEGLKCDRCLRHLNKVLLDLPSVKNVDLNKKKSLVTLTMKETNEISFSYIKEIIEENEYKIKDICVTAKGKIGRQGKFLILDVKDNFNKIYLAKIETLEETAKSSKGKNLKKKKGQVFVDAGGKAWTKTASFFKDLIFSDNKFERKIRDFSSYKYPVRLQCQIRQTASGEFWLSSRQGAKLKGLGNSNIKLAFVS